MQLLSTSCWALSATRHLWSWLAFYLPGQRGHLPRLFKGWLLTLHFPSLVTSHSPDLIGSHQCAAGSSKTRIIFFHNEGVCRPKLTSRNQYFKFIVASLFVNPKTFSFSYKSTSRGCVAKSLWTSLPAFIFCSVIWFLAPSLKLLDSTSPILFLFR